jgi:antitoxin ParD1/3/4
MSRRHCELLCVAMPFASSDVCGRDAQASRRSGCFAKFCQERFTIHGMSTMNISLPDSLKDFVDEQVNERGYGTSSDYVRELIRKDKDRLELRGLLLEGATSAPTKPIDDAYFDSLRRKAKSAKPGTRR